MIAGPDGVGYRKAYRFTTANSIDLAGFTPQREPGHLPTQIFARRTACGGAGTCGSPAKNAAPDVQRLYD